jgi:hypothetical protein
VEDDVLARLQGDGGVADLLEAIDESLLWVDVEVGRVGGVFSIQCIRRILSRSEYLKPA